MMENKKINVDELIDSLFSMKNDCPDLLDEMLLDEGYDPIQLEKEGVSKIKGLLFREHVKLNKLRHESLYSKAINIFESAKADTKDMILSLLMERAPKLQFRNLEKLEEEDLRQILNESDILDLMDKIEKEEK